MLEPIRLLGEQALQDAGYGLRILRRSPGFTIAVILTLALGVGMNTAIFSVVNTVLLRPLDYPDAQRLVWIGAYDPNFKRDVASSPDFQAWRERAGSYTAIAAYGYQQATMATSREARQVTGVVIAGDFWPVTGAKAALGSLFEPSQHEGVVLSWELYKRDFSGDPGIVGRTVLVEGRPATITGVLPRNFRFQFPVWWQASGPSPVEAYFPLPARDVQRGRLVNVVAALKPGVRMGEAQAELETLQRRILEERGSQPATTRLRVDPLRWKLASDARTPLLVLLAAGGFVLLIASANVANLMLAHATVRQREIAIRSALGAGRGRVLRQLLTEGVLLSVAGGAVGVLLARWMISASARISPYAVARLPETSIDLPVLLFTLAISIAAGALFGSAPILVVSRTDLNEALKQGGRSFAGPQGGAIRKLLVGGELALATVLSMGAAFMLWSFHRMYAHLPGFAPEQVLTLKVRLAGPQYAAKSDHEAYVRELLRRLESAPGVTAAGVSNWFLFDGAPAFPADSNPRSTHVLRLNAASTGYLKAVGMRLVKGRWLSDTDPPSAVLLNEAMARLAFGNTDPIGRQLSIPQPATVVGVVSDLKYTKLDAEPPPEIYIPYQQVPFFRGADVAARTEGDPVALAPVIRKLISGIDPAQPVYDVRTLAGALDSSIAPRRFQLFLLGTFAATALLLALAGIYGVISYWVVERTREIGMRVVLGAKPGDVVRMVVREGITVALAGLAAGLCAAWPMARFMESLLYDVNVREPRIFAAAAVVLAASALLAISIPAMRAARTDPLIAFRHE
jgi:putative ABC transport system permease protein